MSDRSKSSTLIEPEDTAGEFEQLLKASSESAATTSSLLPINGVRVGRLVAFASDGTVPLVVFEGQVAAGAVTARATLDLHGSHIGQDVVLTFENGDPRHPVILGCLHDAHARTLPDTPNVELEVDGRRLVVSAKEQLVLRCGKASITLTRAGKVLLQGTYVSSRSTGVLRLKGGSVQIN
jgi:hypothetical protein